MARQETAWEAAEAAAVALGPEAGEFAALDAAGFGRSTRDVLMRGAQHPGDLASAVLRFWASLARVGPVAAARWLGWDANPPVAIQNDKRFADRAWHDNPAFFAIWQSYLAASQLARDLLAAGADGTRADAKAELATGFLRDALAPTNFLLSNPAAIKRALESGGSSVVAGAANFLSDLLTNGGRPRQVDMRPFEGLA